MSLCEAPGLIPLEQALSSMQDSLDNVCEVISMPLSDALGYTLASNIQSTVDVPAFNNSAMDGYAVLIEDLQLASETNPITLTMIGKSFAGDPYAGEVKPGECVRIMTGAVIPEQLNAVVMQEQCSAMGEAITFTLVPALHNNIRFAGEDLSIGQVVLNKGHKLTPRDIPLLASLGMANVVVYRKLKVAILSSGDELRALHETLEQGDIYDTNRYAIKAVLSRLNVEVVDLGIIKDDYLLLKQAIIKADECADVLITSAGVSVGDADYIKDVLNEIGQINFWKLAIKPGKPFAFGRLPNSVFLGLPGNPVSAIVTLYQLAVPALGWLSGETVLPATRFNAISRDKLKKRPGRIDFQRAVYETNENGKLVVSTTGSQGSGVFSSLSQSNCFIVLEQERGDVEAGETVVIEPYSALLN